MAGPVHHLFHGLRHLPGYNDSLAARSETGVAAAADISRVLDHILIPIQNRAALEPPFNTASTIVAWLAVATIVSYVVLADWSAGYIKSRAKASKTDEKSWLMEKRELVPGVKLPREPLLARLISMGGCVAVLFVFTFLWWVTGEKVGLAICAVGLTVRFTFVPVHFAWKRVPGGRVSFNMAVMPWCILAWLLIFNAIPRSTVATGLLGSGNDILPWTMIIVLFGAVYICMSLEATGGLDSCALLLMRAVGHSNTLIFFTLALIAAILTILIPDDVVTLTLAPVVCVLSKEFRLDARPLLYVIFFNANIWAVILVTGNATNTLVAISTKMRFLPFARIMVWPGVVAGCMAVALLYIAFLYPVRRLFHYWEKVDGAAGNDGSEPAVPSPDADLSTDDEIYSPDTHKKPILHKRMWLCFIRFVAVFVFASLDSMHKWPIWLSLAVFAMGSFAMDVVLDVFKVDGTRHFSFGVIKSLPYDVFFFFFALFVLVAMLVQTGLVTAVAKHLDPLAAHPYKMMVTTGFIHLLLSQVLSSAPTSILILEVIARVPSFAARTEDLDETTFIAKNACLWALVLASNFCGNVSRMGTMGGQIWFKIAARHGITLHDVPFLLRGSIIMVPTMLVSMTVLFRTIESSLQLLHHARSG